MQMRSVKSSQISAVGYDRHSRTLEVHFARGGRYQYSDVPFDAYAALLRADSIGSHFHKHIRNGGYDYRRIEEAHS